MAKKKKKGFKAPQNTTSAVGDINVTPLIDIVLVLLIIYMVVTPVMLNQFLINLPEKTETMEEDDIPDEQLLVAACLDGSFTFKSKKTPLSEIAVTIAKKINKSRKKLVVFVDAHPEASYPQVVQLMDTVREAGRLSRYDVEIGVATLKEEKEFLACKAQK